MKRITLTLISLSLFYLSSFAQDFSIGHTTIVFNDAARGNRNIQTDVYYPAYIKGENVAIAGGSNQQFPIVVFGHGFNIGHAAYENIWSAIVPKGYIVAFPKTEGQQAKGHLTYARDLAFLVNAIQGQGNMAGTLFSGKVSNKSCVIGHDLGGGCALLAPQFNSGITTVVALAPTETSPSVFNAASAVLQPVVIFSGSNDCVTPTAQYSNTIYNMLGSNCKTLIDITGGNHCQFANYNFNCSSLEENCAGQATISRATQQNIAMRYLMLWLNFKLKNDCRSWFVFKEDLETSIDISFQQQCSNPFACINPTGKRVTEITSNSAKLKWKGVSCVSTYELRYKLSSAPNWINVGTLGTVTGYQLSGLQSGASYDWSVRTVCDDDATTMSVWAAKKSFTTASLRAEGFELQSTEENEYLINPNPTTGKFQITSQLNNLTALNVQVYNCIGKKVAEYSIKPKETDFLFELDISNEPPGIYFVRINCGDHINTQRIIRR